MCTIEQLSDDVYTFRLISVQLDEKNEANLKKI